MPSAHGTSGPADGAGSRRRSGKPISPGPITRAAKPTAVASIHATAPIPTAGRTVVPTQLIAIDATATVGRASTDLATAALAYTPLAAIHALAPVAAIRTTPPTTAVRALTDVPVPIARRRHAETAAPVRIFDIARRSPRRAGADGSAARVTRRCPLTRCALTRRIPGPGPRGSRDLRRRAGDAWGRCGLRLVEDAVLTPAGGTGHTVP